MKYLILNAIKFTHVGTVTIRVGVRSASTPSLETSSIKQEERQGMRSTDFITKRKAMSDVDDRGDSQLDSGEPSASSMYRRTPDKDDSPSSSRSFSTEQKRTHFTGSNSEDSVERLSKVGNSKFENGSILVRHDSIPGAEPRHLPSGWNEATPMVGVEEAAVPHQHTSESMKSQINANAEEVYLWCEIVDTGVGIPEEVCHIRSLMCHEFRRSHHLVYSVIAYSFTWHRLISPHGCFLTFMAVVLRRLFQHYLTNSLK